MKSNKKLFVLLAITAFGWASSSGAQEFGAVRPAAAPFLIRSNRLAAQEPAQDLKKQEPVAPAINAPQRPDEPGLPELQKDDDTVQQERVAFGPWPAKNINDIRIDIRELSDKAPGDRSSQLIGYSPKQWTEFTPTPKVFAWVAPDIRYQPLFFEDVALERYGQTLPPYRQTVVSAIRMTNSFFLFPNHMRHDPIFSCDYPLGFCRPGDMVDYTLQQQYLGHPKR
jgi:hypothetical protein